MKLFSISLLVTLFIACSPAVAEQEVPPIRNFLKVNNEFCTGAQPRLEHLAKLKADGVKAIINLRQPSEHRAAEEEAEAKKVGLNYFNIPVVFASPKGRAGRRVFENHGRSGKSSGIHSLRAGHSRRSVLDDSPRVARRLDN
jgi:hypothetical protein